MSVRKGRRKDATGEVREFWLVDVDVELPSGIRKRVKKVSPVQSRRAAEQYERELRQAILDGTWGREVKPETPVFREYSKEFLSRYAEVFNRPSEVAAKRSHLEKHLVPAFGSFRLDAIGPRETDGYARDKLGAGLSAKTVCNQLRLLRRMLAVAVEWKLLGNVPKLRFPRVEKPTFDFLTFEEGARILAAADSEWRTMLLVALRCGLRQGELLELQWEDVDLVAGRLVVSRSAWRGHVGPTKSGQQREIPLSDEVLTALKRERHLRGPHVFSRADGKAFTFYECRPPLRRAWKRAGLRSIGWHVLRHTFASHLVMKGVPLKVVQELLGHASMQMTLRYAHLSPDVKRDAVRLLDDGHGTATPDQRSGKLP